MKRIKKLTESDLNRIVKKVIKEESPYDGDPAELYNMYSRIIESEMHIIDNSIETLERFYDNIDMDENLDENDKDNLSKEIRNYLRRLSFNLKFEKY